MGHLCESAGLRTEPEVIGGIVPPEQLAVENQLRESAYRPSEFVVALLLLDHLLGEDLLEGSIRQELNRWISEQKEQPLAPCEAACSQVHTALFQGSSLWRVPSASDPFGG